MRISGESPMTTAAAALPACPASSSVMRRCPANSARASSDARTYSGWSGKWRAVYAADTDSADWNQFAGIWAPSWPLQRESVARLTSDVFVTIRNGIRRATSSPIARAEPATGFSARTMTPSRSSSRARTPASGSGRARRHAGAHCQVDGRSPADPVAAPSATRRCRSCPDRIGKDADCRARRRPHPRGRSSGDGPRVVGASLPSGSRLSISCVGHDDPEREGGPPRVSPEADPRPTPRGQDHQGRGRVADLAQGVDIEGRTGAPIRRLGSTTGRTGSAISPSDAPAASE